MILWNCVKSFRIFQISLVNQQITNCFHTYVCGTPSTLKHLQSNTLLHISSVLPIAPLPSTEWTWIRVSFTRVWPTNLTLLFSRNESVSRKKESSQLLLSQTAGLSDIDTNLDRTDRTLDRANRTLTTRVQNGCNRTCVSNLSRITLESFHFEWYRLQRHHVAPIYI